MDRDIDLRLGGIDGQRAFTRASPRHPQQECEGKTNKTAVHLSL
jgi:hypothetical protein